MCLIGYSDTIKKASFILIYRGIFMREKFSYNEFLDLIEKNEWQADKYKSKFIPNHMVTEKTIRSINIEFDKRVIGQQAVKEQILKAIFPIMNNVQCKPIVLLFYGNSGIGKTETAQFLTEQIGGKILRKQFSMYQNNEFANYLF